MNEELYGLLGINPEDIRKQQLQSGLLGAGLQLLAGSGYSPVRRTTGELLGQAGAAGMMGAQQAEQDAITKALRGIQAGQLRQGMEEKAAQKQAIQNFVQTLPEDQRAKFAAFPAQAAEAMFKEANAPGVVGEFAAAVKAGLVPPNTTLQDYIKMKQNPPVSVNVSTEKSYGGALAGEVAKSDAAKFEAANVAPRVVETVQSTRQLLDSGNVITGIGAQQRLDLARFGQLMGVTGKNTNEIVANTQQLFANRAQATLDSIRSSGLGAGQGFSNKDREFLENAKLGNITYSPEALRRQLDIEENVARASVQSWNNRIKNIPQEARQSLGLGEVVMPEKRSVSETPKQAPAGVRQELWDLLTPEQKRLWK